MCYLPPSSHFFQSLVYYRRVVITRRDRNKYVAVKTGKAKVHFILSSRRSSSSTDGSVHFIIWIEFSAIKMEDKSHVLGTINRENPKRQGLKKLEVETVDNE